jgi:hypothetical protein
LASSQKGEKEMKYGQVTMGQVEAAINKLGGMPGWKALLRGDLNLSAAIFVSFFCDRPGLRVSSKLGSSIGFERFSVECRSVDYLNATSLEHREYTDWELFHDIYDIECVELGQIMNLIQAQLNGKSGLLLTDGMMNIFPIRGKKSPNGEFYIVSVKWVDEDKCWVVSVYDYGTQVAGAIGNKIFRNNR